MRTFQRILVAGAAIALIAAYPARIVWMKGFDHVLTLFPAQMTACPKKVDAFLVLGQSQGANTGQARTIAQTQSAWSFLAGQCWHLQDPVKGPPENGGSIWPSFADHYGAPVLIANMAISGSSITQWTDPAQLEKVRVTVNSMRRDGYEPTVIWLNGETDAAAKMSAAEYLRHLRIMAQAVPNLRWLITTESRCYAVQTHYRPLDEARRLFVQEDPARRRIGGNLDAVGVEYRAGDQCHLNRDGQQLFGRELAVVAKGFR